jgi:hypothetical protein
MVRHGKDERNAAQKLTDPPSDQLGCVSGGRLRRPFCPRFAYPCGRHGPSLQSCVDRWTEIADSHPGSFRKEPPGCDHRMAKPR